MSFTVRTALMYAWDPPQTPVPPQPFFCRLRDGAHQSPQPPVSRSVWLVTSATAARAVSESA